MRRPTQWVNNQSVFTGLAAGGIAVFDILAGGTLPPGLTKNLTCKRLILDIGVQNTTAAVPAQGAYGIEVGSERAMPTNPDSPILDQTGWYYHKNYGINTPAVEFSHDLQDIRTARKVLNDRTLWFILEVSGGSASGVSFIANFRLLISA